MKFKEYMNLRLFDGGDGDDGGTGSNNEPETVTMSQKDFDAKLNQMFAKGSKKALKDFQGSDEYKELLKLKDDNSTETEKMKEKLSKFGELENQVNLLTKENNSLKNRAKVKGLKDPDQLDYIMFEVEKLIDDKTDFDDALKIVAENKSSYFKSNDDDDNGGNNNQNFRSSSNKGRGGEKRSEQQKYLDQKYGKNPYYKK